MEEDASNLENRVSQTKYRYKFFNGNKFCCIKFPARWSMKTQISIIIIMLFLIIFFLGYLFSTTKIALTIKIFQNSQNQIYIQQANKNLATMNRWFKRFIKIHFNAVRQDANHFQKIYLNVERNPQNLSQKPQFLDTPYILSNKSDYINSTYDNFQFSWVCYSAFDTGYQNDGIDNSTFINSVKHFNQIHPLIQNQYTTYLTRRSYTAFYSNQSILYLFPCSNLPTTYVPNLRPWYVQMISTDQQYRKKKKVYANAQVVPPHLSLVLQDQSIEISLIQNLFDKNYNFNGVSGSSLEISKFSKMFSLFFLEYAVILVNFDGNLLISPYFDEKLYDATLSLFINNTTITGLDQEDWTEVKRFAILKKKSHNCTSHYLNDANLLCRWDKNKQRNVLIFSSFLKAYNYYIVILLDEKQFLNELQNFSHTISQQMMDENDDYFFWFVGYSGFMFFMILLMLNQLFKPLDNMTTYCLQIINKDNINQNKQKKRPVLINEIITNGVFYDLTYGFYVLVKKLAGQNSKRNQQCTQIEMVQYPKIIHIKLDIEDQLQQIDDLDQDMSLYEKIEQYNNWMQVDKFFVFAKSYQPKDNLYNRAIRENSQSIQVKSIRTSIKNTGYVDRKLLLQLISQHYKSA